MKTVNSHKSNRSSIISKTIGKINFRDKGILIALIILWVIFIITNKNFRRIDSFLSILREASFVGVAAIGMTFCIASKQLDLSVGSMLALLSIITVSILPIFGLVPTLIIILVIGGLFGLLNGTLVAKLKIPPFIATLGMYFIYRALAFIISEGPIRFSEKWFTVIGNGSILGIPIPFIIFIVLTIIGTFILRRTTLGRYTLAIGNSEKASNISGINIDKVKILVFGLVGVFTAAAAILITSRLWSANPGMKYGYEFDVIAAVVLGGTSLDGGKGSIVNTFIASIFFASLNTAMNMFHIDSYMQRVVIGLVLLFAFSLNGIRSFVEEWMRVRAKSETV